MAAHMGKDVKKLKAKGGKWKYMSEKDMLEHSAKFSPYQLVFRGLSVIFSSDLVAGVYSCGTCGA